MKNYDIVLAGCGVMANTCIDYTIQRENAELVALVDVNREAAKAMAEKSSLMYQFIRT